MIEIEIWWSHEKIIFEICGLTTNLNKTELSINRNDEEFLI